MDAEDRLQRRRHWFRRVEPGRLELVHAPVYIVEATVRVDAQSARGVSQKRVSQRGGAHDRGSFLRLAVDALHGRVERLDREVDLNSVATPDAGSEGTSVPPILGVDDAIRVARRETPWLALHFSLRRGRRYELLDLRLQERIGYPYWIQHFACGQRRDFSGLDAVSGGRIGPRTRRLLIAGLIRLAQGDSAS